MKLGPDRRSFFRLVCKGFAGVGVPECVVRPRLASHLYFRPPCTSSVMGRTTDGAAQTACAAGYQQSLDMKILHLSLSGIRAKETEKNSTSCAPCIETPRAECAFSRRFFTANLPSAGLRVLFGLYLYIA